MTYLGENEIQTSSERKSQEQSSRRRKEKAIRTLESDLDGQGMERSRVGKVGRTLGGPPRNGKLLLSWRLTHPL